LSKTKNDEPASELLKKIKAEKEKLIAEKKLKKEKELPPIKPEEIPFEIPENWVWRRLGELTIDVSYGTSEKADLVGEVPVLRMGNITTEGQILYSNLKYVSSHISDLPKLYLQNGDLVFNRTNSYELVGKTAVFENSMPYTLASYLIRVRFLKDIHSKFIAHYVNSKICRETQLEPQIIQQNGQANFNGTKLSNIIIPIPPFAEQSRIVKKLEELMLFCNELEASIKESQSKNEKLLQQVLREALKGGNLSL
jgi:type I restriction enzyme S subunit